MKQPHIQLDESLNVRYAILPGDPRRAERIASHMSEVEDLGMNREYRSLVGAYRGARILAMSTGMGGVSTGIAVEELHNIGVTHAIRIGSCGALQTDIALGELLIAAGAVRDDGTSRAYVREGYPAVPDTELLLALTESIRAQGFAHRLGIIRSHESFYIDDIEEINEYWSKKGVLGSDMETAALLTVGRLRGHEMRERAQQRRALEGVHFPRRRLLRRRRRRGRRGRGAQHSRRAGDLCAARSR